MRKSIILILIAIFGSSIAFCDQKCKNDDPVAAKFIDAVILEDGKNFAEADICIENRSYSDCVIGKIKTECGCIGYTGAPLPMIVPPRSNKLLRFRIQRKGVSTRAWKKSIICYANLTKEYYLPLEILVIQKSSFDVRGQALLLNLFL